MSPSKSTAKYKFIARKSGDCKSKRFTSIVDLNSDGSRSVNLTKITKVKCYIYRKKETCYMCYNIATALPLGLYKLCSANLLPRVLKEQWMNT